MFLKKKGFTLIELLVVMIIVGVLAAVAIPLMRGNVVKARKSEAVAALGSIRTGERAYFAQYDTYINVNGTTGLNTLGIGAADLDGRYYSTACYSVTNATTSDFIATANPGASTAARNVDVAGTGNITIDATGSITGY